MRSFEERKAEILRRSEVRAGEIRRRWRRATGMAALALVFVAVTGTVLLHSPGKITDLPKEPATTITPTSNNTSFDTFTSTAGVNGVVETDPEQVRLLADAICEILDPVESKAPPAAVESDSDIVSDTPPIQIGIISSASAAPSFLPSEVIKVSLKGDVETSEWLDIVLETEDGTPYSFRFHQIDETLTCSDTDTVYRLTAEENAALVKALTAIQNNERNGEITE